MRHRKIVVLGGSGFIGSTFRSQLQQAHIPHLVTTHRAISVNNDDVHYLDIFDGESIVNSFERIKHFNPTSIINCVALGVNPSERGNLQTKATRALAQFSMNLSNLLQDAELGLTQLVHLTTSLTEDSEYQDPYVVHSRFLTENLKSRVPPSRFTVLSLPRVFGLNEPPGRFLGDLARSVRLSSHVKIIEPCRVRNYLSLTDLVNAVLSYVQSDETCKIQLLQVSNDEMHHLLKLVKNEGSARAYERLVQSGFDEKLRHCDAYFYVGQDSHQRILQVELSSVLQQLEMIVWNSSYGEND